VATPKEKLGKATFAMFRPGKYMQSKADEKAAAAELANAERMRAEAFGIANQLNWEPDYVSDLVQPYQKAQSPVARSFLESLLTGANPSMVQSTRLGANRLQAGAQAGFDEQTGGWDQLLARQREADQQTPWAPKTYGHAPAVHKLPQAAPPAAAPPGPSTPEEAWYPDEYLERLRAAGIEIDPRTGKPFGEIQHADQLRRSGYRSGMG
jgi:hypothetical protein